MSKHLSGAQIQELKTLHLIGLRPTELAVRFDCCVRTVENHIYGKTKKHGKRNERMRLDDAGPQFPEADLKGLPDSVLFVHDLECNWMP